MPKSKLIKKIMTFGYIAVIAGIIITFWGTTASMKTLANNIGENATTVFHKDKVESLLLLLDSDRHSSKEKNDAIWALGVLKDERALNKLESLMTEEKSGKAEKYCRREIEKSIEKIKGKIVFSWPEPCKRP
jgi:hypothetical protein